jgi:hypothetical protein
MPDRASKGLAAVVWGGPTDEGACLLTGFFGGARDASEPERPVIQAQWSGYLDKLEGIGISRAAAANWITWPATVIRLKATALFEQTPGPQAGTQLI